MMARCDSQSGTLPVLYGRDCQTAVCVLRAALAALEPHFEQGSVDVKRDVVACDL
jgi:hypothetical protein